MREESIVFRPMREADRTIVAAMIQSLYKSLDAPEGYMTYEKISATFEQTYLQPDYLNIEVFESNETIVGYALLFKFWYNEFGGMILNIDELYVTPDFQRRGIASLYLSGLEKRNEGYVGLSIEVLPENKKAYALYKKMGYMEKETKQLYKLLK